MTMKRRKILIVAGAAVLVFAVAGTAIGVAIHHRYHDIPLDRVPPAALNAARLSLAGVTLHDEAELERECGKMVYEFKGTIGNRRQCIEVSPEGEVVRIVSEIPLHQVPAPVVETARKAVPGVVLLKATKETMGNDACYKLDGLMADKTNFRVDLTAEGKLVAVNQSRPDRHGRHGERQERRGGKR